MEPEDNLKDSPEDEPESPQAALAVQPREMWEKQPDESQRAYSAFSIFRDSEKRSLKLVATSLNPPCSIQNVFWWSTRHNWKLRVDAFDLWMDQQQRQEFARSRVKMRERHLAVAKAMLNVAAHGLKEWQGRIEGKLPLHLEPEQIAMLVRSASELERSVLGVDVENRATAINILFSTHRYDNEKAGGSGEVEGEVEYVPIEEIERRSYEKLSEAERRNFETWKDAPKLLTEDGDKTKPPN